MAGRIFLGQKKALICIRAFHILLSAVAIKRCSKVRTQVGESSLLRAVLRLI